MRTAFQVFAALMIVGLAYLYVGLVAEIFSEALWPWV